jgi:hypothetical protein
MEKQMNLKRAFIILIAAMLLLPGLALAQSTTVRFAVEKHFTDFNPSSIEVTLACNTGLPLTQTHPVSQGDAVIFVIEEVLLSDFVECVISEDGEAGYNAIYNANDVELEDDLSIVGCFYDAGGVLDNLDPELNTCEIINTPAEVPVIITKLWDFEGAGGDEIDTLATVWIASETDIDGGEPCGELEDNLGEGGDLNCRQLTFIGPDPDPQIVLVKPEWDGTNVYIFEKIIDSAVESENGCDGMVEIFPTEGASCIIHNTVFFEGIPTLNQYGLAILAVLMLGVGFVGFRRFV